MKAIEYIPRKYFQLWYDLFKQSGARLLNNPIDSNNHVYVSYEVSDMKAFSKFQREYEHMIKPIVETRCSTMKKFKRKLLNYLKLI